MKPPFIDLLVLPCAGASAAMYRRWRHLLPDWIRLVPVELPGHGSRLGEPLVDDFGRLVAQLCDEQASALRGRYALFGHSMGALLACGIARRQRELTRPMPRALFASGCAAPSRRDPGRFAGKDDDAAMIADLRKQGGTPQEVFDNAELLGLTLGMLRADYRLCAGFCDTSPLPLPLPVHALGGRDDCIPAEALEAWRRETQSAFSLDWFDGGHFFIQRHERQVVATIVRELVRQVCTAPRPIAAVPA